MMDDTTKKIIRSLAKHQPRNKIITELCEYSGLNWDEAESLLNEIEKNHATEIYSRQRPFYILLGSALALGGLLLSIYMLYASFNGLVFFLLRLPIPYLGNAVFFILGILVFIGGLKGVVRIGRG
jgi:hypothetical protein